MARLLLGILLIFSISQYNLVVSLPHPPTTAAPLVAATQQFYDKRFDSIDLDEILGQERLLKNYVKCLESTGPCTPDGKELRELLPDAISTDCAKCTEGQKQRSDKVTRFLIDNRPEDWTRLEKIYDPEGSYRIAYTKEKESKQQAAIMTSSDDMAMETNKESITKV